MYNNQRWSLSLESIPNIFETKIERYLSKIINCLSPTLTTIDMFTVYALALKKKTPSTCVFSFVFVRLCMYLVINIKTSVCVCAHVKQKMHPSLPAPLCFVLFNKKKIYIWWNIMVTNFNANGTYALTIKYFSMHLF